MLPRRRFLRLACAPLLAPLARPSTGLALPSPYLQDVRPDRATVCWLTEEESPRYSFAGASLKDSTTLRLAPSETGLDRTIYLHRTIMGALEPAQEYRYALESASVPSAGIQFRTPARSSFRFLVFGDSGAGNDRQRVLAGMMAQEDADFVLHTGDLAYPVASYEEFLTRHFNVYQEMMQRVPFYPCVGNHEYAQPAARPYRTLHALPSEEVPEADRGCYYSFNWGPLHFISLDSDQSLVAAVNGQSRMLAWLENDLTSNRQPFTIAYFHHTPYAGGPHENNFWSKLVQERILPLLEKYGVRLVFAGHEHSYQRTRPIRNGLESSWQDGICYVTTGGGGGGLYPTGSHQFVDAAASVHHYVRATLEDRTLRLEAVSIEESILDSLEFSVPVAAAADR